MHAPRRCPFQNISRKNVGAFTAQHPVESPRREKRTFGGDQVIHLFVHLKISRLSSANGSQEHATDRKRLDA